MCFVFLYVWIVFRSVCRVSFTCMLYQCVLGVRMHVLGVHMFVTSVGACFACCFCDAD